jgi:hypothetical protein
MNSCRHLLIPLAGLLPLLMAGDIQAAASFDPSTQPLGAIAPLTLNNTNLVNGAKAYRPWFENGAWQGDVIEYDVSTDGVLTTSVDLTDVSPVNTGTSPANWSAHVQFAAAEAASASYWEDGRKIISNDGNSQKAFVWHQLTPAQKLALDPTASAASADSSDIFDYIRGDRSNEAPAGAFRARYSLLGDIIHSNPVYVGPPARAISSDGYAAWAELPDNADRAERVYVGANDGMLHVFDAANGNEVWAYVPSTILAGLNSIGDRPYPHLYSLDGNLTAQDVYFESDDSWQTVLVGGLGAGGKAWYALDITDENLSSQDASSGANDKILWEIVANNNDALGRTIGHSYGQPVITKLNDDRWYAVVGNGYNSINGIAVLLAIDVETGTVKRLSTSSGSAGSPNGLSAPSLVDTNRDGLADIAFAGDIDGHLWKFDISAADSDEWGLAYSEPLHPGTPTQPIIQAPEVTLHPAYGLIVYFGTGRLFTAEDMDNVLPQALYGIWDQGAASTPPDAASQRLFAQTLSGDKTYISGDITETVQTFNPDPGIINWAEKHGWKVELPVGFHVLTAPQLRGGRVKVTIHEPRSRSNYILEAYYLDGGSPGAPIFDLNQSGSLTVADNINANGNESSTDREDIVTMWRYPAGVMSQTTIARVSLGVDVQLVNFLVPPAGPSCVGDCIAGFQGGHIDVDTDWWDNKDAGVGGKTEHHSHEYDKKTGRVYVDYFDHGSENGHVDLDDTAVVGASDQWIVVVANADMSPGSVLTIGEHKWNVVRYQKMLHEQLYAWRGNLTGSNRLKGDDDEQLIFTTGELNDELTIRHEFDDMAILAGGLHPTNTDCVNEDDAVTNGRYRNGALVTQLINVDAFDNQCNSDGCQLDNLILQSPSDMISPVQLGGEQVHMGQDYDLSGTIGDSAYEVFGGLRADISGQGDDDAFFESTLFWHYKGPTCYGEDNWETDVAAKRNELIYTQEEFDAELALGLENGDTDLDLALINNATCGAIEEELDGSCEAYYQVLLMLKDKQSLITDLGTVVNTGTGVDGEGLDPVVMEEKAPDLGLTSGPNFSTGRRTWIDITDEAGR